MSEITDLAKTIREENEKTRTLQERLASGTRENGQFASKEEITVAKKSLKKQDDQRATTKKILGISEKRMAKAEELTNQIQAQEQIMAEQKASLEESGVDADKTAGYQKEQLKLDKLNAKKDDVTGASASEDEAKASAKDSKMMGYLKQTAGFLGGIAKQGMQKVKSGLGGFSKFLFGALALAALAFLDHPKFKEIIKTIKDLVIPALAYLYDKIIKPLAEYIGGKLKTLFGDIKAYIDGDKGLGAVLWDNIGILAGIVTALAPNLVFGALKLAVTGLVKGAIWLASKLSFGAIFAKIGVAFTALKTFFVATLWPAITGFMIPLLPIIAIAAGIVLALVSLKKAFDDFMFELEATGSIWEATKTAIMSFYANFLGFIPNLIKSTLSWIIGKIGSIFGIEAFADVSKAMDEFDFVDMIMNSLTFVGDAIAGLWDGLISGVQKLLRKLSWIGGGKIADKLFGTEEKQATEKKIKEAQQKRMVEDRKALKEKEKLEKAAEEEKKLTKIKAEQNTLQPKSSPTVDFDLTKPATVQKASNIVSAPTSIVNANQSSSTSHSTSIKQPDPIMGMLLAGA